MLPGPGKGVMLTELEEARLVIEVVSGGDVDTNHVRAGGDPHHALGSGHSAHPARAHPTIGTAPHTRTRADKQAVSQRCLGHQQAEEPSTSSVSRTAEAA